MNEASTWLLRLARKNAEVYAADAKVQAIMVTGSVANGYADHYSDIDTIIYYDELPSDEYLATASMRAGGSQRGLYGRDIDGIAEYYYVRGVKCEFAHSRVKDWEQIISDVVERYDTDPVKQKMLSGLVDAVPLYGSSLVERWKQTASAYPDKLAQAIVKSNLRFHALSVIEKRIAERDSLLFVHELLVAMEKSLLSVLVGLNHMYDPIEWKRMDWWLGKLAIAPTNLSSRLKNVLLTEPEHALPEFAGLVREVFDLIDTHMPQVDTTLARREFYRQQERWGPIEENKV